MVNVREIQWQRESGEYIARAFIGAQSELGTKISAGGNGLREREDSL